MGFDSLTAIAGRAGVKVDLELSIDSGEIPVLLNLKPPGSAAMEHFHHLKHYACSHARTHGCSRSYSPASREH